MQEQAELRKYKTSELRKELAAKYWKEIMEAPQTGKRVVWAAMPAPAEIVKAMDFLVVIPEQVAAVCSVYQVATKACEAAEGAGYSYDLCTYPKTTLGMALQGEKMVFPLGILPKPDLLLTSDNSCIQYRGWFQELSRLWQIPLLAIDCPVPHDDMSKDELKVGYNYVEEQLQEVIAFLENFTGRPYNYDRLGELIDNTRRASALWREIRDMGRAIPSPLDCFALFVNLHFMNAVRSEPESEEFLKLLKAEMIERVAQKIAAVPGERFRLMWEHSPIWFRIKKLATTFASYGCCLPVAGTYNMECWELFDSSRLLDSIAEAVCARYVPRGVKYKRDYIIKTVKDYSLDGLVLQWSQGCRPTRWGQLEIAEAVEKELGIPSFSFQGDLCDPRWFSEAQFENKLQTFIELLESRRWKK